MRTNTAVTQNCDVKYISVVSSITTILRKKVSTLQQNMTTEGTFAVFLITMYY